MGRTPNTECEVCGDEFYKRPNDKEKTQHDYCSNDCMGSDRSERYSGENNPNYRGGSYTKSVCAYCGETFEHRIYDVGKFCSHSCNSSYHSGEKSHRWKGGKRSFYGTDWSDQRKRRIEKDNGKCVVCKMTNDEHRERHGESLHVHHIRRINDFEEDGEINYEKANNLNNLVTVCRKHHVKWEGIPLRPQ